MLLFINFNFASYKIIKKVLKQFKKQSQRVLKVKHENYFENRIILLKNRSAVKSNMTLSLF